MRSSAGVGALRYSVGKPSWGWVWLVATGLLMLSVIGLTLGASEMEQVPFAVWALYAVVLLMAAWMFALAASFPGLALYKVIYSEGPYLMCSTRMAKGVLVIETTGEDYGISPAEEDRFVAALRARTGV